MSVTVVRLRAGVVILLSVTACSGSGGHPHHGSAQISGVVRGYGGPAILVHGRPKQALNGDPMRQQEVTASRSGEVVAATSTDRAGRYVLALQPGSYMLKACGMPKEMTVRAGESRTVDLNCLVP